jgi:hypothetical protein
MGEPIPPRFICEMTIPGGSAYTAKNPPALGRQWFQVSW